MKEWFVFVDRPLGKHLGIEIRIGYVDKKDIFIVHGTKCDKEEDGAYSEPTLYLPMEMSYTTDVINQLVDGLIAQGAKPTKPIRNNEEMEAIKYHLEDMRKLVFEKGGKR